MAGARQLLRELLRERRASFSYQPHPPRPAAAFSHVTYQRVPLLPDNQQAVYVHGSESDEEYHRDPQAMSKCFSRVTGSVEEANCMKPSLKAHTNVLSGDSCHSSSSLHAGSSVFSLLSQIRAGCTSRFGVNGHALQMGRYCSTVSGHRLEDELGNSGLAENADGLHATTADVAAKLVTPEAQAVSEVSTIIGDCSYPTAFLQLFIDTWHSHLGLPWWAALVAATLTIRTLCIPIVIYQLKSTAKLTLMRPEMEKINERLKNSVYDASTAARGREEMFALFKKYNTNPISPFVGAFLQAPIFICFFFAIQNMCQRLESFKTGGLLLFSDLTVVDSTYILPLTLSATMLLTVELNAVDGMEGSPHAEKMKQFMRIFSVVLFPVSLNFETALFFYWIPSNVFATFQSLILKKRAIKEFLAIPLTEHLAQATSKDVNTVEPALSDTSSIKGSVRKKLGPGRSKVRGSRRR